MIIAHPFTPKELAKEAYMAWKQPLRADQFERLRVLLKKFSGMDCPENRRDDLLQATALAAKFAGDVDTETILEKLGEPGQEALRSVWISGFTIHETYFFRDAPQWNAIRQTVLPERIAARRVERTLKVWSAGCSTGDEAYTVAMLLDQMLPDAELWNIRIIGTDISGDVVQKARKGVYREWSFRQTPMHVRDQYFEPVGGNQWRISERLTKRVRFEHLNLKTGVYPSIMSGLFDLDLILCRNVLIYFARDEMDTAIRRMTECLAPGGFLALGPAEPSPPVGLPLELVASANSAVYRQNAAKAGAVEAAGLPRRFYAAPGLGGLEKPSVTDLLNAASLSMAQGTGLPPVQVDMPGLNQPKPKAAATQPATPVAGQPENALVSVKRLAEAGQWEGVIEKATEQVRVDPLNADLQYLLGLAMKEKGRVAEAREALRKCLFINNRHWLGHLLLAGLWQRDSQDERAKSHLAAILKGLELKDPAEVLPDTDGMTVGRMRALADSQLKHLEGRN